MQFKDVYCTGYYVLCFELASSGRYLKSGADLCNLLRKRRGNCPGHQQRREKFAFSRRRRGFDHFAVYDYHTGIFYVFTDILRFNLKEGYPQCTKVH